MTCLPTIPANGEKKRTKKFKNRRKRVKKYAHKWDRMIDCCCILPCAASEHTHTHILWVSIQSTRTICYSQQARTHIYTYAKEFHRCCGQCIKNVLGVRWERRREKTNDELNLQPTECFFRLFFRDWGLFIKNLIATLIRKVFMNFNLLSLTWGWSGFFWVLRWSGKEEEKGDEGKSPLHLPNFSNSFRCNVYLLCVSCSLKKSCIWTVKSICTNSCTALQEERCNTNIKLTFWISIFTMFIAILFFYIQFFVLRSSFISYTPTHR